ncbi:hypothetical protein GCM10009693_23180 [Leucobacter chromiireducens subsp. chromiireducens]
MCATRTSGASLPHRGRYREGQDPRERAQPGSVREAPRVLEPAKLGEFGVNSLDVGRRPCAAVWGTSVGVHAPIDAWTTDIGAPRGERPQARDRARTLRP